MNRSELRSRMKLLLSRNVPETDLAFVTRCNQCIDLALRRLSSEVPAAVLPVTERAHLLPEYATGKDGSLSRISTTSDDWVLEIGIAPYAAPDLVFPANGTWDAVYWLEITLADGQKIRRQCREFWTELDIAQQPAHQYVSLVTPMLGVTFTGRSFRLYQPHIYLPHDNIDLLDATIEDVRSGTITTLPEGFARDVGVLDGVNGPQGQPVALVRSEHYQLDAPQKAPTMALIQGTFGLEAIGAFNYVYTYAWGKRDASYPSAFDNLLPLLESGPSPVGAGITVTDGAATSVQVTVPNIDWMVRFNTSGTLRSTHSGLVKRIYRARTSVGTGTVTALEARGTYEFMAEIDGATTTWTDDGSRVPDYYGRLPEISGYYRYRPYPQHDAEYRLVTRAHRRPRGLDADYDQAPVSPECIDALLYLACAYLSHYGGEPDAAKMWDQEAFRLIGAFRARHANPSKVHPSPVWGTPGDNWSSHAPNLTWTTFAGS